MSKATYRVEHYLLGAPGPAPYETETLNGIAGQTATALPKTGYAGCACNGTAAGQKIIRTLSSQREKGSDYLVFEGFILLSN